MLKLSVMISTAEDGFAVKDIVDSMGFNREQVIKTLFNKGRFSNILYLIKSEEVNKRAQEFLDLYFQGKINPDEKEILEAVKFVPHKKNILKLFENKKYGYEVFRLSKIFKKAKGGWSEKKNRNTNINKF